MNRRTSPPPRRRLRAVLAAALVLGTSLGIAWVASAQIPVTDTAHIAKTILHYAARLTEIWQKYEQIRNQVRQLARQAEQLELQIQGLKKLDRLWLRRIGGTIGQIESVLDRDLIPSHLSAAVRLIHGEAYPGWSLPADWWEEEELAAKTTLRTLRETLWAKHLQHRTTEESLHELSEIKLQLEDAEGHQEILEALATLSAFESEAGILAQLSAQVSADAATAYYSYTVNRRARQEASFKEAIYTSDLEPPSLGSSPGWGALPNWFTAP